MDIGRKQILARVFTGLVFAALYLLSTLVGFFETSMGYRDSTWLSTACSLIYIFGNFGLLYAAWHYCLMDTIPVIGAFWLMGTIGFLFQLLGRDAPIFLWISVLPVALGFVYDFSPFWQGIVDAGMYLLYFAIPILCGVLVFLLWRKSRRIGRGKRETDPSVE